MGYIPEGFNNFLKELKAAAEKDLKKKDHELFLERKKFIHAAWAPIKEVTFKHAMDFWKAYDDMERRFQQILDMPKIKEMPEEFKKPILDGLEAVTGVKKAMDKMLAAFAEG